MADPKQLTILKRLTSFLETNVTQWVVDDATTLTYQLAGRVWRGRTTITAGDAEDALSLLEAPRPIPGDPAAPQGIKRLESWTVLLQGFPKDDKENPSDPAYYMKAATELALSKILTVDRSGEPVNPDVYLLGPDRLIGGLTIGQGVVRPASQEVSRLAMFYIPLVISLTTDVSNP